MKLLLILGSDETSEIIARNIKPLGFEIIRYRHVLKAMDNIDEIDPAAIIVSARDFPRHWKIVVQFVRTERSREICPIILLTGTLFSLEDAAKAFHIGVNGIVREELDRSVEMDRLQSILERYLTVEDKRKSRRYHQAGWTNFGLCLANPRDKAIITGTVETISATGVSFLPDDPALLENIPGGAELSECSLRIGDSILSPICRIIRREPALSLEFAFLAGEEQIQLESYLEDLPLWETRAKQGEGALPPLSH
jgi:DNA-binding response OmpR family regulator